MAELNQIWTNWVNQSHKLPELWPQGRYRLFLMWRLRVQMVWAVRHPRNEWLRDGFCESQLIVPDICMNELWSKVLSNISSFAEKSTTSWVRQTTLWRKDSSRVLHYSSEWGTLGTRKPPCEQVHNSALPVTWKKGSRKKMLSHFKTKTEVHLIEKINTFLHD